MVAAEKGRVSGEAGAFMLSCPDREQNRSSALALLRIENWLHIERAYGEAIARSARDGLCRQLAQLLRDDGKVAPGASGTIELRIAGAEVLGRDPTLKAIDAWLTELCCTIPMLPISTCAGPILLWVSSTWSLADHVSLTGQIKPTGRQDIAMNFHGEQAGHGDAWASAYRADMTKTSQTLSVIGSSSTDTQGNQACLFWQAIRDGSSSGITLYHEALLRIVDKQGIARPPVEALAAFERLGFIGLLDRHVVSRVIEELEASQEAWLGANISALRLCSPALWDTIITHLRRRPDVAARLFIEITETAAIPDMGMARQLIDRLRGLGCQIVLDDFGMGHASIRQALALAPDVIKIDKFFLHRGLSDAEGRAMLSHLIGLAQSLKAALVIEGVETREQAELSLMFGVTWQQGWYWGRPSASRPWRIMAHSHGNTLANDAIPAALMAKGSMAEIHAAGRA